MMVPVAVPSRGDSLRRRESALPWSSTCMMRCTNMSPLLHPHFVSDSAQWSAGDLMPQLTIANKRCAPPAGHLMTCGRRRPQFQKIILDTVWPLCQLSGVPLRNQKFSGKGSNQVSTDSVESPMYLLARQYRDEFDGLSHHCTEILARFTRPLRLHDIPEIIDDMAQTMAKMYVTGLLLNQAGVLLNVQDLAQTITGTMMDIIVGMTPVTACHLQVKDTLLGDFARKVQDLPLETEQEPAKSPASASPAVA